MIRTRALRAGAGSVLALVTLLSAGCATAPAEPLPQVVSLSTGAVRGTDGDGVRRFRGIPYAAAPVGELRFAPPSPAPAWTGERDATVPGPACAQPSATPGEAVTGSEDCLTVDVTAPVALSPRPRPVLVWLHGGGLSGGTGNEVDPTRMVTRGDIVVVTVEFRVGPLGFLGHPAFDGQGGTLGFADQQAALRWVRDEIGAFGGDPGRVVVGGQSGGSIGACAQLLSPTARGLFDGAILQSGSCDTTVPPVSLPGLPPTRYVIPRADSETQATAIARRLGCTDPATAAACLRALPVEKIVSGAPDVTAAAWGGPLMPRDPAQALRDPGAVADVPVLSGNTRDEGTAFAQTFDLLGQPLSDATLRERLTGAFGERRADRVEQDYPADEHRDAGHRFGAATGDAFFACPQAGLTANLSHRAAPVFGYEFADRTSPGYIPILDSYRDVGASHASELPYLFDFPDKPIDFTGRRVPLTAAQRELGDTLIDHWTRFVRDGDPGWARYAESDGRRQVPAFAPQPDGTTTVDQAERHHCGFWARG